MSALRTTVLALVAASIVLGATACKLVPQEGQFECADDSDCPREWVCDLEDHLCYSSAQADADAGGDADTDMDTDSDADTDTDTDIDTDADTDTDTDTDTELAPCPEELPEYECTPLSSCESGGGTEAIDYSCDPPKICCYDP